MGLIGHGAALSAGLSCAVVEKAKFAARAPQGCSLEDVVYRRTGARGGGRRADRPTFEKPGIDWERISDRVWRQIGHHRQIEESLNGVENLGVYKGTAEFTAPYVMRVKNADGTYSEEFRAEKIVLAAGARSFVPPIEGLEQAGYVTSELFFGEKYPKTPWKSLVIVGGGAIGAEFAHIFSAMGTKVTIVECGTTSCPPRRRK